MAFAQHAQFNSGRLRSDVSEALRRRALERLYRRREAVDELIRSLEAYQIASAPAKPRVVSISVGKTSSSGCAR